MRLPDEGEQEARTLAFALVEIEESCRRFVDQIAELRHAEESEAGPRLEDLREELRHVLYHIRDSGYLSVIDTAPPERG